jgi:hypothetical protein
VADIRDLLYCTETGLLVVHSSSEVALFSFAYAGGSFKTQKLRTLVQSDSSTRLIRSEHGTVFVHKDGRITAYPLSDPEEAISATASKASASKPSVVSQAEPTSSIDPDQVTVEDIKRFEALMKGKAVAAVSNATAPRGLVPGLKGQPMF